MDPRISLTIAEGGENHRGMEILGKKPEVGTGFTPDNIESINTEFTKLGYETELLNLNELGGIEEADPARVLIVRKLVNNTDEIFKDLLKDQWDTKFFDIRRQKVLNKRARYNLCYMENFEQEPNYWGKKGRVVDLTKKLFYSEYKRIVDIINNGLENKQFEPHVVEGNYYYNKNTGIGYHGDTERSIVVAVSLGGGNEYPMKWRWFEKSKHIGETINVKLGDGDLYIMSEKAVGMDWRSRNKKTLRHAAGSNKYIK